MMGLLGDKKKMASLILSEAPKNEEKKVPSGVEGDFSKACEQCASELIDGIKAGDPRMVSRALKHFVELSGREDEYSDSSEA